MKINIEFKPKEWICIATFVIVVYLICNGQINEAILLLKQLYKG